MDNTVFQSYNIEDQSYNAFIKREIHNLVKEAGFSETRTAEIDIVLSELISNLIKHAGRGELLYRLSKEEDEKLIEIFCLDKGPGTNDIARMMEDGVSTANTQGNGLGAMNRLCDVFQIYSRNNGGTTVYAKCFEKKRDKSVFRATPQFLVRTLQVCLPGEKLCGDGYTILKAKGQTKLLVVDGLGHGPHAHDAAQAAIKAFQECREEQPEDVLRYMHLQIKKTRGVVASIVIADHIRKTWTVSGIGNISTIIHQPDGIKKYNANNGIIGFNIPRVVSHMEVEMKTGDWITISSDGIQNKWNFSQYPHLQNYDPALVSAILYRDQGRKTDDMTMLVGKING